MKRHYALVMLCLIQIVAAARVFARMAATANGQRVRRIGTDAPAPRDRITILVPVLNEVQRLSACLDGVIAQGAEVTEVLVIDGGSTDGTQHLIEEFAGRDTRVRLVNAAPVPHGVNGKAHGLAVGLAASTADSRWILTLDADVRPSPALSRSLLAHASREHVNALSIATQQRLSGAAEGVVHPAMLATLVYRFGIPGHATTKISNVQANGQCFLVRRDVLEAVNGFSGVMHSICEDVTLGRMIAGSGQPVGFYESDHLVTVEMYAGWRDAWQNWARSLPMRDRYSGGRSVLGLVEIFLVQALPPWLAVFAWFKTGTHHPLFRLNAGLAIARCGVLQGMARAYEHRPWTFWLSPLADLPVAFRLVLMYRRRHHTWRGRAIVAGDSR